MIKFNQNAWLKPYIDMNTDLRKKVKIDHWKKWDLMNNAVFGKTKQNVRKHSPINPYPPDLSDFVDFFMYCRF